MSLQDEANIAMDMVFNMFKRDDLVTFYKSAAEVVVSQSPNWNADFQNPYATNITRTSQSQQFECRIIWSKFPEQMNVLDGDENLGIKASIPMAEVKLQMKQDGFDWLRDTKTFWIKNERYEKASDWRGVGMLGEINRYEVYLKKSK